MSILGKIILTTNSTADIGPTPIISGSIPVWVVATILARGFSPFWTASSADINTTAAAPSLTPDEFPGVTVPSVYVEKKKKKKKTKSITREIWIDLNNFFSFRNRGSNDFFALWSQIWVSTTIWVSTKITSDWGSAYFHKYWSQLW